MNILQVEPVFYIKNLIQSLSNSMNTVIIFFLVNDEKLGSFVTAVVDNYSNCML